MPTPKRMVGTPRSATASSTARVAGRAKRAYSPGASEPAQLSKSCTAWAPASICARSEATAIDTSRSVSCPHSAGSPCIKALTLAKVPRRAPLDEVAGHGERRAGKPDERHPRPVELTAHQAHRLGDVGGVDVGLERTEAAQVVAAAEGLGDHGPPAGLHVDPEADGLQGHDDVGEQDGGVHAVAPHRLEGQLGGQRSVRNGRQDGALAARGPVLGQRPAGLAHEPHRRAGHRFPEAGAHEVRAGCCRPAHSIGSMTTAVP